MTYEEVKFGLHSPSSWTLDEGLVLGLTAEHRDLERVSLGSLKTAAGVAMAVPGGSLVGGAMYAGAIVYEHREAIGEALNVAWNRVTGWLG